MSACAMQTFNNVTAQVWACCKAEVANYGIQINTNTGSSTSHGFKVSWNFDPAAATLQIQVLERPDPHFIYTCSAVNGRIHDAIAKCYDNHGVAAAPILEG